MFQNKNLSVIAYANGFTLWQYKTQDKIDDLQGKYFPQPIRNLMNNGDIMIINASDGTTIRCIKNLYPLMEMGKLD